MVGPISSEERASFATKVKLGFTVLIGLSAGLVTLQGDPSPLIFVGAVVGGLVVGGLLVWFVFPGSGEVDSDRDQNKRERF
jgi:membrane associated rhomboid family serine protease